MYHRSCDVALAMCAHEFGGGASGETLEKRIIYNV